MQSRLNPTISKIMTTAVFAIVGSCILIPFSAILLKQRGYSETEIGIYLSMAWIGLLLFSSFIPQINQKFGTWNCYLFSCTIAMFHVLILMFTDNYYLWCATNFLLGLCWGIRWVTGETIIVSLAPETAKGKVVGIYGTLVCACVTLGPLILLATGVKTNLAFYVSLGLMIVSFILVFRIKREELDIHSFGDSENAISKYLRKEPIVLILAIISGMYENGLSPISPIYGISVGLPTEWVAALSALIGFGTFATQYIIGAYVDKNKSKNVYLPISIVVAISSFLLFLAPNFPDILFLTTILWGAFGGGIYTIVLIKLGYKYSGQELLSVNAFIIAAYTLGGVIGPFFSGISMDILPQYGLPTLLSMVSLVLVITSINHRKLYARI